MNDNNRKPFDYYEYYTEIKKIEGESGELTTKYYKKIAELDKKYGILYRETTSTGLLYTYNDIIIFDSYKDNLFVGSRPEYEHIRTFEEHMKMDEMNEYTGFYRIPKNKIDALKESIEELPESIKDYILPSSGPIIDGWGTEFYAYDYKNGKEIFLHNCFEEHLTWINNLKNLKNKLEEFGLNVDSEMWSSVYNKKPHDLDWYIYHSKKIAIPLRIAHSIIKFFEV